MREAQVNPYARQDFHQFLGEEYVPKETYKSHVEFLKGNVAFLEKKLVEQQQYSGTLLNLLKKIQQQQKDNQKAFELFVGD